MGKSQNNYNERVSNLLNKEHLFCAWNGFHYITSTQLKCDICPTEVEDGIIILQLCLTIMDQELHYVFDGIKYCSLKSVN